MRQTPKGSQAKHVKNAKLSNPPANTIKVNCDPGRGKMELLPETGKESFVLAKAERRGLDEPWWMKPNL